MAGVGIVNHLCFFSVCAVCVVPNISASKGLAVVEREERASAGGAS